MINQDRMIDLARDRTITPTALRILFAMTAQMDYTNMVDYTQTNIKELLHMDQSDISKALKILESKGLVEKVKQKNKFYLYKLNSDYFRKVNQISRVK